MDNSELITAEQYDLHPEYAAAGLKVGDPVPAEPAPADVTTPVLRYAGKVIISATDRIVEERSFKSIRLEDGSTCDISEEEYQEIVKASQQ